MYYKKFTDEEIEELLKDEKLQVYIVRGIELKWWSSGDYDEIGHYHLIVFKGTLIEKENEIDYHNFYHFAKKYGDKRMRTDENDLYKLVLK